LSFASGSGRTSGAVLALTTALLAMGARAGWAWHRPRRSHAAVVGALEWQVLHDHTGCLARPRDPCGV